MSSFTIPPSIKVGLIWVKEEGWTVFSEGWQSCSEEFPWAGLNIIEYHTLPDWGPWKIGFLFSKLLIWYSHIISLWSSLEVQHIFKFSYWIFFLEYLFIFEICNFSLFSNLVIFSCAFCMWIIFYFLHVRYQDLGYIQEGTFRYRATSCSLPLIPQYS